MAKAMSDKWGAVSAQNAKIAEEGRRPSKAMPPQTDSVVASQPHEAVAIPPEPVPPASLPPIKVEKRSTSLYLTPAAHRIIRVHAAKTGVKSNTVYEDALRDYFAKHDLGDFDKANGTAS